MIFNAALMLVMNLISLSLFMLLLGYPLAHPLLFLGISCFGACSISLVFSFLAAIAARAQQNAALMAILGFPLIIPQLMLLMRLSTLAFSDVFQSGLVSIILLLASFDVMIVVLSVILFPFLWKD
jgi:heme exporter protein B